MNLGNGKAIGPLTGAEDMEAAVKALLDNGARAVIVAPFGDGTWITKPVEPGCSVLNINRDLLKHLNEYPHTDAWLAHLRDYCIGRITARQNAQASGKLIRPSHKVCWDMIDIPGPALKGGA